MSWKVLITTSAVAAASQSALELLRATGCETVSPPGPAPHQASYARATGERVSLVATQAILDWMAGRRPQFLVNPNVLQPGVQRTSVRD